MTGIALALFSGGLLHITWFRVLQRFDADDVDLDD